MAQTNCAFRPLASAIWPAMSYRRRHLGDSAARYRPAIEVKDPAERAHADWCGGGLGAAVRVRRRQAQRTGPCHASAKPVAAHFL